MTVMHIFCPVLYLSPQLSSHEGGNTKKPLKRRGPTMVLSSPVEHRPNGPIRPWHGDVAHVDPAFAGEARPEPSSSYSHTRRYSPMYFRVGCVG